MRSAARRTLRAFAIVACADPDTIMQMRLDERTSAELGQLIEDFLRYHVEDALPTRGSRVVKQLLHQNESTRHPKDFLTLPLTFQRNIIYCTYMYKASGIAPDNCPCRGVSAIPFVS